MKLSIEKLKEIFPDGKIDRRGKNWITLCPECHHREFSISLEENHQCGCFRKKDCGWTGNVFTLMKKIGRVDILVNKDINFKKIERIKILPEETKLDLDLPDILPPLGWKRIKDDEYLNRRGFKDYFRYRVGITSVDPRLTGFVVFLVEEQGKIKGWVARNKKDKKEIEKLNENYKQRGIKKKIARYLNSDSDFAKLLFGLDELSENTKMIIIVEGIFDKIKVDDLLSLHEQDEIVCLASFKCGMSSEQIFKIQENAPNLETTILLYDPDVIDAIKKTAFDIDGYLGEILIGFAKSGHDPGDFTEEDIEQVFNNLESPTVFNTSKVNIKKLKI